MHMKAKQGAPADAEADFLLTNGFSGDTDLRTQMLATKLTSCSYILVRAGDHSKSELLSKRGKLPQLVPQYQMSRNCFQLIKGCVEMR
jgi:hypothetical protein